MSKQAPPHEPWRGATPVLQGLLVPLAHRLMRHQTMHYELVIDPMPAGPEAPPPKP